jgi:hypothetical protein
MASSSKRMRAADAHVDDGSDSGIRPHYLNGRAHSLRTTERTHQPIPHRLSLPFSPKLAPPENRDSTRVLLLTTGRFGIVFARDENGKRPRNVVVPTMREAQLIVGDQRRGRNMIIAFLVWVGGLRGGR